MKLSISVPANFNFWRTVYSHGWCSLPPFAVNKENRSLALTVDRTLHGPVRVQVSQVRRSRLTVAVDSPNTPTNKEQHAIVGRVKSCFRLDEDFSEFYAEAKKHRIFRWVPKIGAGRLLRAPTVFEDVVKMICTTNCSWALTETMVRNLCEKLGSKLEVAGFTFPKPEAIADCTEKFLRREIHAGYRAPYILELSKRIASGELELESWRGSDLPTDELFQHVRSVKGVGPYAAGNILKLLGRYDYLAIDSWCRKQFIEIHKNGRKTSDLVIEKFYEPFGKWKGLFFWMDVTKHWHKKQFPF